MNYTAASVLQKALSSSPGKLLSQVYNQQIRDKEMAIPGHLQWRSEKDEEMFHSSTDHLPLDSAQALLCSLSLYEKSEGPGQLTL